MQTIANLFAEGQKSLAVVSDRTVRLWRLSTGEGIRTIECHSKGVACVNITGQFVVTKSRSKRRNVFGHSKSIFGSLTQGGFIDISSKINMLITASRLSGEEPDMSMT